jgi:hypothetical protein
VGAAPLAACRAFIYASLVDDPTAVLILKGTVGYPQKDGRPRAEPGANERCGDIARVNGHVLTGYPARAALEPVH